jgi:hypothetical protein
MSSAACITFDPDTLGVPADPWQEFCAEYAIVHSPQTVGGNVYYASYASAVEVYYTVHKLVFSTYGGGRAIPEIARLAKIAWFRWGHSRRISRLGDPCARTPSHE